MRLALRHETQIQADLQSWAGEHVQANPNLFELLPHDPEKYEYQRLRKHTVEGAPLDPAIVDSIAESVDSRYPALSEAIDANEQALTNIGETLDSRQNVVVGTDHAEIIDIALLLVRLRSNLASRGYEFSTGLIANKIIAYLGVKLKDGVLPATDLLSMGLDAVYLNIPRTLTGKQKVFAPKDAIASYNSYMVEHGLVKRLESSRQLGRAVLIGAALTGTTNKGLNIAEYNARPHTVDISPDLQDQTEVVGRANNGNLKFTAHALSYVASVHLGSHIEARISEHPKSINSPGKLDAAMKEIVQLHNQNDPSAHYVYDEFGDLPVIKSD